MELENFKSIVNQYIELHKADWLGLHDCHHADGLAESIENNGLLISHSTFKKKWAEVPLGLNFKTTMFHINTIAPERLFSVPVCPIFIRIPKELLEIAGASAKIEDDYKKFSTFGHLGISDGTNCVQITPLSSEAGANVNMLPNYLIEGHLDMDNGELVPNPNFFENLSSARKSEIISAISQQNKQPN